jgi:hypothetical protein
MKLQTIPNVVIALLFLTAGAIHGCAQQKSYEDMSRAERVAFVGEQARRIGREISGSDYAFTPAFEEDIQKAVMQYATRVNKQNGSRLLPVVFARGTTEAPKLIAAFEARNVSPLIGLYIPWVESAYVNIQSPNSMGAIGMFQFLPTTGEHYGLSAAELLDVDKSADAAARYIIDSLETFKGDPMKEALALLSYNRGVQRTARDLKALVNEQNKQCSICALNADRDKLDETFRTESVYYVPLFFAAAVIGENPQVFGLQGQPLSAY